jgi:hypothetical protein
MEIRASTLLSPAKDRHLHADWNHPWKEMRGFALQVFIRRLAFVEPVVNLADGVRI